jgi:hypothetical protein
MLEGLERVALSLEQLGVHLVRLEEAPSFRRRKALEV